MERFYRQVSISKDQKMILTHFELTANIDIRYETKVQDFNFGTLLRNRAMEDYAENNAFFVTRLQFYAIEITRNRFGLNSIHYAQLQK
jgi:hypothetical protein